MERRGDNDFAPEEGALETAAVALISEIAVPLSDLATLIGLAEEGRAAVSVEDMLAAARRLVNACGKHGIALEGQVGERRPFDPERHEALTDADALLDLLLSPAEELLPGQPVVVRCVGVAYRGKSLRKAGVESIPL